MNNKLFTPIGYYYSLFHLSLSILSLDINTDLSKLEKIHHVQLFKLIKSNLVQTKILNQDCYNGIQRLKYIRENCNYKFGYSNTLEKDIDACKALVDYCFDLASRQITQILNLSGTLLVFQVGIGDGFGDDILDTYLSRSDKKTVSNFIVSKGLSS